MKEDNRLWILIGRKLSGEATENELKELAELSQKDPDVPYYITILSVWWNRAEHSGKMKADKALSRLLRRMEKKESAFLSGNPNQGLSVIRRYLKAAFRHLWKNSKISLLNTIG